MAATPLIMLPGGQPVEGGVSAASARPDGGVGATSGAYRVRLADGPADVAAAQALRFGVFNLELQEGLAQSYGNGLDVDPFDPVCDHLLVEQVDTGAVVGTYRMQTGRRAREALGYYSEAEFDFSPFEPFRDQILELGRACVHRAHRNFAVLNLLWRGIAAYAQREDVRYLMGCSSLTSQDTTVGAAAWLRLQGALAAPAWRTQPRAEYACALAPVASQSPNIPRLLSAYLMLGAAICAPPAIDRAFRTIDFLTWLDVQSPGLLALQRRGRFLG